MRSQKQHYEILSRTMKQQFELHESKYRQVFAQKLNLLAEEHTRRANRFGVMFQEGISKLTELNHDLLMESKFNAENNLKKDQFNIMLNDLPSQEILDLNNLRNGFESSRHNISDDQSMHLGQQNQGFQLQIPTERKAFSVGLRTSRILQAKNENQQEASQSQEPQESESSLKLELVDSEVQTDKVICFSDYQEGKMKGYCYFEDDEVQTQLQQNREALNVGIQVQFTLEMSSQTDISHVNKQNSLIQTSQSSNTDSKQISTFVSFNDMKQVFQQYSQTEGLRMQDEHNFETDQNSTVNKKNVFKISLNLQHVVRNRETEDDKGISSRILKSTARDSEGHTDRKIPLTPKSSHQSSIYQEDFSYGFQPQVINEEDTLSQKERQNQNENENENQNQELTFGNSPTYYSEQVQTQFLGVSIGIQIDAKFFDEIDQDERRQRNYLVTQQSEDQHDDANLLISQEYDSRKESMDQFTVKKERGRNDQKDFGDQTTKDKSKIKLYDISDFQKPQPLIDKFNKEIEKAQDTYQKRVKQDEEIFKNATLKKNIHSKSDNILECKSPYFQYKVYSQPGSRSNDESDDQLTMLQYEQLGKELIRSLYDVQEESIQLNESIAPKESTHWDINQIYIIKTCLVEDETVRDELLLWKNGLFSLKSQKYLRRNGQMTFVSDPNMLILGNSEITAWGKSLWVRNNGKKTGCFEGTLEDCNLRVLARYCYTIQQ